MSTPIKPPGGAPAGSVEPSAEGADRVEGRPGELRGMVRAAASSGADATTQGREAQAAGASPVAALRDDLEAGRIDGEQAIERLVQRALVGASGLSETHRAALESHLRESLAQDPTLAALRKDLQSASKA